MFNLYYNHRNIEALRRSEDQLRATRCIKSTATPAGCSDGGQSYLVYEMYSTPAGCSDGGQSYLVYEMYSTPAGC